MRDEKPFSQSCTPYLAAVSQLSPQFDYLCTGELTTSHLPCSYSHVSDCPPCSLQEFIQQSLLYHYLKNIMSCL